MNLSFSLLPWKVTKFLIFTVICLDLLSLTSSFAQYFLPDFPLRDGFSRLFDVGKEFNIPTFYAALTLLICSILIATIAYALKQEKQNYVFSWYILSSIFFFLSIDEIFSGHEILSRYLEKRFDTTGLFAYAWVIPGAGFVLICLVSFWKFLMNLPFRTRNLFIIAGGCFVGGAIGIEMIGGQYADLYGEAQDMTYSVIATFEESLEMVGIILLIHALLDYITKYIKLIIKIRIDGM